MTSERKLVHALKHLKWALKQSFPQVRPTRLYEATAEALGFSSYAALTAAIAACEAAPSAFEDYTANACLARLTGLCREMTPTSPTDGTKNQVVEFALDEFVAAMKRGAGRLQHAEALAAALEWSLFPTAHKAKEAAFQLVPPGPVDMADLLVLSDRIRAQFHGHGGRMWLCGVEVSADDLASPDFLLLGVLGGISALAGGSVCKVTLQRYDDAILGYRCAAARLLDQDRLSTALQTLLFLASHRDRTGLYFDAIVPLLRNELVRSSVDIAAFDGATGSLDVNLALSPLLDSHGAATCPA